MNCIKSVSVLFSAISLFSLIGFSSAHAGSGGHGNLSEKMNSLFPKKEAATEKRNTPAIPQLVSPQTFAKINGEKTTLKWNAVNGAEEYHLQVATDPNFKWLVANEHHVKGTTFEIGGLEPNKEYFWRVAAFNSANWSTFRKSLFARSVFSTTK